MNARDRNAPGTQERISGSCGLICPLHLEQHHLSLDEAGMIPWELLASVSVTGGEDLHLLRRGGEFSIRVGARELMNSRAHGSEETLAELACDRLESLAAPVVLIGGLGMGYTLAAALRRLPEGARVEVVELLPAVVDWNMGILGHPLGDPRVSVLVRDVAEVIAGSTADYDAILLDVDNGPAAMSRNANATLYSRTGLDAAMSALGSGGVLGVWSAGPDPAFSRRLQQAGFDVHQTAVQARGAGKGGRHTIWVAVAAVARPG
jgi:spermidine synthase